MAEGCTTCKFARTQTSTPSGFVECHRHAPQPAGSQHNPLWPRVLLADWCGEFVAMVVVTRKVDDDSIRR